MLNSIESLSDIQVLPTSGFLFDTPTGTRNYESVYESPSNIFRRKVFGPALILPLALQFNLSTMNLSVDDEQACQLSNSNHSISFGYCDELANISEEFFMQSFINFLDNQIESNPDLVVPVDIEQLNRISQLIEGVDID